MSDAKWFTVGLAGGRFAVGYIEARRTFAPERRHVSKVNEDEEERERGRAQRATDPRAHDARYRPRMAMLADEPRSLAEQGTDLDEFIDPDEPGPRLRKRLRNNYRYGRRL